MSKIPTGRTKSFLSAFMAVTEGMVLIFTWIFFLSTNWCFYRHDALIGWSWENNRNVNFHLHVVQLPVPFFIWIEQTSKLLPGQVCHRRSRDGAVVRTLASHQCVPGLIPGPGVICGLNLLLVLFSSLLREVFPQVLRFSPLLKNQHFQIPILAWKVSPISARALEDIDT